MSKADRGSQTSCRLSWGTRTSRGFFSPSKRAATRFSITWWTFKIKKIVQPRLNKHIERIARSRNMACLRAPRSPRHFCQRYCPRLFSAVTWSYCRARRFLRWSHSTFKWLSLEPSRSRRRFSPSAHWFQVPWLVDSLRGNPWLCSLNGNNTTDAHNHTEWEWANTPSSNSTTSVNSFCPNPMVLMGWTTPSWQSHPSHPIGWQVRVPTRAMKSLCMKGCLTVIILISC